MYYIRFKINKKNEKLIIGIFHYLDQVYKIIKALKFYHVHTPVILFKGNNMKGRYIN